MSFFNTHIVAGSDFSKTSPGTPDTYSMKPRYKMGLEKSCGTVIKFHEQPGTVIGVVKDFHFESLHKELEPALLRYDTEETAMLYAKVPQQEREGSDRLCAENVAGLRTGASDGYSFLDDQLAKQYDKGNIKGFLPVRRFRVDHPAHSCLGLLAWPHTAR